MNAPAIKCEGLGKRYRVFQATGWQTKNSADRVKYAVASPFRWLSHTMAAENESNTIWALRDFRAEIGKGERVGIIGANGSGKTTLLKMLSRVTEPTEGRAVVRGRVGSLLEVGTGFNLELTGRENVYLYGAILGMSKAEITAKFDEIIDFAACGRFIDTPVKRYSLGMRVRLGFSVAAHLDPDILLMDEVLSVGDTSFQKKCVQRMQAKSQSGATVLLVSHHMEVILGFCERVIWLNKGRLISDGPADRVIREYMDESSGLSKAEVQDLTRCEHINSRGDLVFTAFELLDSGGERISSAQLGKDLGLSFSYESKDAEVRNVSVWVRIYDNLGRTVLVLSTNHTNSEFSLLPKAGKIICRLPRLSLAPGNYRLGIQARINHVTVDHIDPAGQFDVMTGDFFGHSSALDDAGVFFSPEQWELQE